MSPDRLTSQLDSLLASFNRRSMDVPDGLFDRNAQLKLNGVAYETMLGRSPGDPLVRMIARGAAGYRFAAKALLHALVEAHAVRGGFEAESGAARGTIGLSGRLRGANDSFEADLGVEVKLTPGGGVVEVNVQVAEEALLRLRRARALP